MAETTPAVRATATRTPAEPVTVERTPAEGTIPAERTLVQRSVPAEGTIPAERTLARRSLPAEGTLPAATMRTESVLPRQRTPAKAVKATPARSDRVRTVEETAHPTFDAAVALVIGRELGLRAAASPKEGWLTTGGDGGGDEIAFSAYGTTFYRARRNPQARDAWQQRAWAYEDIDHEVFNGKFDLIDVNRLRGAQQAVDARVRVLDAAVSAFTGWAGSMERGRSSGGAADLLSAKLRELREDVTAMRDQFTVPDPTVSAALGGAADALAEFARQLSYVWWESNQVLLGGPDDAIQAIVDNMQHYLQQAGLLGGGGPAVTDQAAGVAYVRGVLANYSSDAAGGLLPGMDPIAGDLAGAEVWAAANASITRRLATEMDKLDEVAEALMGRLGRAYGVVTDRLGANEGVMQPARVTMLRAPAEEVRPAGDAPVPVARGQRRVTVEG